MFGINRLAGFGVDEQDPAYRLAEALLDAEERNGLSGFGLGAEQGPLPKPVPGFVGQKCSEFLRMAGVYDRLSKKSDKKKSTRERAAQYAQQERAWYQQCVEAQAQSAQTSAPVSAVANPPPTAITSPTIVSPPTVPYPSVEAAAQPQPLVTAAEDELSLARQGRLPREYNDRWGPMEVITLVIAPSVSAVAPGGSGEQALIAPASPMATPPTGEGQALITQAVPEGTLPGMELAGLEEDGF